MTSEWNNENGKRQTVNGIRPATIFVLMWFWEVNGDWTWLGTEFREIPARQSPISLSGIAIRKLFNDVESTTQKFGYLMTSFWMRKVDNIKQS